MTFASATVLRHLLRGVVGLAAFIAGFAVLASHGAVGLIGLAVAAVAWRGCPTCWALGLLQTRERAACACAASIVRSQRPGGAAIPAHPRRPGRAGDRRAPGRARRAGRA